MVTNPEEVTRKTIPVFLLLLVLAACASTPVSTPASAPAVISEPYLPTEPTSMAVARRQPIHGVKQDDLDQLDRINHELEKIQEKILELRGPRSETPY